MNRNYVLKFIAINIYVGLFPGNLSSPLYFWVAWLTFSSLILEGVIGKILIYLHVKMF